MKIIYGLHDLEPSLVTLSGSDLEFKQLKEHFMCDGVLLNQDHTILKDNAVYFSRTETEKILYIIEGLIVDAGPCHNYFTSEEIRVEFLFSQNEYR